MLTSDGTIQYFTGYQLGPTPRLEDMRYSPACDFPVAAPIFGKIAYWNNKFVGIDGSSQTWNLTPRFKDETYSASDPLMVDPVTEFTATDAGLVGLRSDGYLYKRIV